MTINDWLFLSLLAASIWRRQRIAVAFSFLYLLQSIADPILADWAYYWTLIVIDAGVALSISAFTPSRSDLIIAACSGMFLVINSVGAVMWWLGMGPDSYDHACTVAYIIMFASLIRMRPEHGSCDNHDLDNHGARAALRARLGLHTKEGISK